MLETAPLAPIPIVRPSGIRYPGISRGSAAARMEDGGEAIRRVERRQHANVVAAADELLRECFDVPVHAPLIRP